MSSSIALTPIRSRTCFLRVKKQGKAYMTRGLGLQTNPTPSTHFVKHTARIGFIVTKRLGNAVQRNRVKRRLRAVVKTILPDYGLPGYDYVIMGRYDTATRDYKTLLQDLKYALKKTGTYRQQTSSPTKE